MVPSRHLPTRHNPFIVENIPSHAHLVEKRRLGQTQLNNKMVPSPTALENHSTLLGVFDFAHLRVPLPRNIVSGIFKSNSPPSYFLMRRSYDGYISATGMFRATFPFATAEEEEMERKYILKLPTTSPEETAANLWIPEEQALELAQEYQITPWIQALLDPTDIIVSSSAAADGNSAKKITPPPKFSSPIFTHTIQTVSPVSPVSPIQPVTSRSSRARRSVSPTKLPSSKRVPASPRKRRTPATLDGTNETVSAAPSVAEFAPNLPNLAAASVEQEIATIKETVEGVSIETSKRAQDIGRAAAREQKVKVHVEQEVQREEDGNEVVHTEVEVEMPFAGEPPSAEETAQMIAAAKEMAVAAAQASAASAESTENLANEAKAQSKRKADELAVGDEDGTKGRKGDGKDGEVSSESDVDAQRPAKRTKTVVEQRKEQIKKRAYIGISATIAIGALTSYVLSAW